MRPARLSLTMTLEAIRVSNFFRWEWGRRGREGLWAGNFLFALWRFFFTGSPTKRITVQIAAWQAQKGEGGGRGTLQSQPDTCFALFKIKGMKLKRAWLL